jgi:hypothetical protein
MTLIKNVLLEFWLILGEMAPYLLFGFLVAGLLSILISRKTVERNLGGGGFVSVLKAALFGVPLPLCSCGVIPVAASLRKSGASRSATVSFLLSTPQTGVDSIFVTYSLLGPVFAVFRPIAALITGLLGGSLTQWLSGNGSDEELEPISCKNDCYPEGGVKGKLIDAFNYGFVALPQDIGKALVIGLIIAALMSLALPDDFFAGLLGVGILPMLVMMLGGIPIYVCATASVPIAAALIAKGISPGAALVFLMTGPATNAAAISTIWKILGRRTAFIYLFTVAGSALAAGFLLDYIFTFEGIPSPRQGMQMLPSAVNQIAAVLLLGMLGHAWYRAKTSSPSLDKVRETEMETIELHIKGMTCNHCVASVKRALEECPGVKEAEVNLNKDMAFVYGEGMDPDAMKASVEKIGYTVIN